VTGAGTEEREADAPVVVAAPVKSDGPAVGGGKAAVADSGMMEEEEEEEEGEGEGDDRESALARMRASSFTTPWYMFCHVRSHSHNARGSSLLTSDSRSCSQWTPHIDTPQTAAEEARKTFDARDIRVWTRGDATGVSAVKVVAG
jgi:hypothetical protein